MVGLRGLDAEPANPTILHYIENISQTDTFIIVGVLLISYCPFGCINLSAIFN